MCKLCMCMWEMKWVYVQGKSGMSFLYSMYFMCEVKVVYVQAFLIYGLNSTSYYTKGPSSLHVLMRPD